MADPNEVERASVIDAKRAVRQRMRAVRRDLPDRAERSARILQRLVLLDELASAERVHVYESISGEVETADLIAWCIGRGIEVAIPEDDVEASWPDVVIVPGTAFTSAGERVGQGGGWYDRFLPGRRDDAVLIGLAFAPQMVQTLPAEAHDVVLDMVITDEAVHVTGVSF